MSDALVKAAYDALVATFGRHEGRRAAHTRGRWAQGTFTATPGAQELSRAPFLDGEPVRALVRFSNGSGHPGKHDGIRDGRGMGVKLFVDDDTVVDFVSLSIPFFTSRTPEDFVELVTLARPDPETGQPDFSRLGPFLEAHPETAAAIQARFTLGPPASYLDLAYNGIHSFRWTAADGTQRWVRTRWVPDGDAEELADDEAMARDPEYLADDLRARLAQGPAAFTLLARIADEGDAVEDCTAAWPEDRAAVPVGRLELDRAIDDPETPADIHVFDPLRLCDGIEPSDDPILHFRRRVYDLSARARWVPDSAPVV